MALSNKSLKGLANKMCKDYATKIYESEAFTEICMNTAEEYLADVELEQQDRDDLHFMLMETIRLSTWTD